MMNKTRKVDEICRLKSDDYHTNIIFTEEVVNPSKFSQFTKQAMGR